MNRAWPIFLSVALAWLAALAYSGIEGRALYADGAYTLLYHLQNPHRFNDYDWARSFASFLIQAPILLGQRLGVQSVASFTFLLSLGLYALPALTFLFALFLSRAQPGLFAANVAAITVFGFGANFINTEGNLLMGFAWLAITIMALERPALVLRGFVLPLLAVVMVRVYEGMLLVGPVLAAWAVVGLARTRSEQERIGLTISAFLFIIAAVIGAGSFLAPRDPGNAANFTSSAFLYLRNPQVFLLGATLATMVAIGVESRRWFLACVVVAVVLGGFFLAGMVRLQGYFSYGVYYQNRSFLALVLPVFALAVLAIFLFRPAWMHSPAISRRYAMVLLPFSLAIAADLLGTHRWIHYVNQFCDVLEKEMKPEARLAALKQSGARTGWGWTHPTLSVLLRGRGSNAMVTNDAGQWQPFDPATPPFIRNPGVCQAPFLGKEQPDSFAVPMLFTGEAFPTYVASVKGLSKNEGWATWSEGDVVEIRFRRPLPASFELNLKLASALGRNKGTPIRVRAGGQERSFIVERDPQEVAMTFTGVGQADTLFIQIPHAQSPKELKVGADERRLGLAFVALTISPR